MSPRYSASALKPYIPAIIFTLVALIAYSAIEYYFGYMLKAGFDDLDDLNKFQDKAITIIIEMNKLVISLALLIIGALGGFLLQKYQAIILKSPAQKILIILSLLFAISSIYFGYNLYFYTIDGLMQNGFDPRNPLILKSLTFQAYSFLISLMLFGAFIVNETFRPQATETKET